MKAHCTVQGEFLGMIKDNDQYEGLKAGVLDWKPHVKEKMTSVTIPFDLFLRLMALDTPVKNESEDGE